MARESGARVALAILVLPGLTDRASELDALGALIGDAGASVLLRDLGADARRAIALAPTVEPPRGMDAAIARLLEAA